MGLAKTGHTQIRGHILCNATRVHNFLARSSRRRARSSDRTQALAALTVPTSAATLRPMSSTVAGHYRYPVKGLSAEALNAAELRPGSGIRFDRAFGLALSTTQYDAAEPHWLPKSNFVTLVAHERPCMPTTTRAAAF